MKNILQLLLGLAAVLLAPIWLVILPIGLLLWAFGGVVRDSIREISGGWS